MKKLYSLIIASTFTLFTVNSNATTINVSVASFAFSPQTFTAVVGDDIVFTLMNGSHNVTSPAGGVPSGAAPIASGPLTTIGQSYTYHVAVAGNYGYQCTLHPTSMIGGFSASVTGIAEPTLSLLTSVYPSPFKEKVSVKYNGIEGIEFINMLGETVKSVKIESQEGTVDVDFDNMPAGIYFYRTYKDGIVFETRKIVKTK